MKKFKKVKIKMQNKIITIIIIWIDIDMDDEWKFYLSLKELNGFVIETARSTAKQKNHASEAISKNSSAPADGPHLFSASFMSVISTKHITINRT